MGVTTCLGKQRGWKNLKLYSDTSGDFTHNYVGDRDADMPGYTVFTLKDGGHLAFLEQRGWAGDRRSRPGSAQCPDMNPLWIILDTTPEACVND